MTLLRHSPTAKVADACADEAEVLALATLRMVVASYSTGDVACWDMAYARRRAFSAPKPTNGSWGA